jgi:hypothetical protein
MRQHGQFGGKLYCSPLFAAAGESHGHLPQPVHHVNLNDTSGMIGCVERLRCGDMVQD